MDLDSVTESFNGLSMDSHRLAARIQFQKVNNMQIILNGHVSTTSRQPLVCVLLCSSAVLSNLAPSLNHVVGRCHKSPNCVPGFCTRARGEL